MPDLTKTRVLNNGLHNEQEKFIAFLSRCGGDRGVCSVATDQHRLSVASLFGGLATISGSAATSMIATLATATTPLPYAAWVWTSCLTVLCLGLGTIAYKVWRAAISPKPPRKRISARDTLATYRWWFPSVNENRISTGLLQDVFDNRLKVWGRKPDPTGINVHAGWDYKSPLIFIAPDFWASAQINWSTNTVESLSSPDVQYVDLILERSTQRWRTFWDVVRRRFSTP